MSINPSVLIVEDSPHLGLLYTQYLRDEPIELTTVETGAQAFDFIKNQVPSAMVLDLQLPDMNGLEILNYIVKNQLPTSVVVVTGHGSVNIAVEAMRAGAFDFIEKPFVADRLLLTLRNALGSQKKTEPAQQRHQNPSKHHEEYHSFIGSSVAMQSVYRIIDSAARSKATVFITGESGTGKELCAEAIFKESDRDDKPFVALNCAAIPRDLMESEIFGHIKGAFTGAHNNRQGAASRADGGTLFLDEICEMDLDLQTKLLRFIQSGTFQKVGSSQIEKVDIRFICATNRDPLREVAEGRFREDLYYRLHVVPIYLAPLRDRDQDTLMIARTFLDKYATEENKNFTCFSVGVEKILLKYNWPGNVRQLQNVVRNIVVLNNGDMVTEDMLPPPLNNFSHEDELYNPAPVAPLQSGYMSNPRYSRNKGYTPVEVVSTAHYNPVLSANTHQTSGLGHMAHRSNAAGEATIRPLWLGEKETIEQAIALCSGNIPKAAALLEISASTIYRKRQHWESKEG